MYAKCISKNSFNYFFYVKREDFHLTLLGAVYVSSSWVTS